MNFFEMVAPESDHSVPDEIDKCGEDLSGCLRLWVVCPGKVIVKHASPFCSEQAFEHSTPPYPILRSYVFVKTFR